MKGQISIDYVAGGLVFFGAIIFLVGNLLSVVPQFQQQQQQNDLQMAAYAMSEVLLNDRGYWANATHEGTDWEDHTSDVETIGLSDGSRLVADKVNALLDLQYTTVKEQFNISQDFNIELHEFVDVDTHRTFEKGDSPGYLTPPSSYSGSTSSTVHYGAKRIDGQPKRFLLTDELSWYNKLRVSDDWDFSSGVTVYNLTEDQFVPVGPNTYTIPAFVTRQSDGKLLVLRRRIGRIGRIPPSFTASVTSINRYGVLSGNVVRLEVQIWP